MARLPRLAIAGLPHHIIQHGNNRQPIITGPDDAQTLVAFFAEGARQHGVLLHAYVVMNNHFHLLATPPTPEALSRWLQGIGRSYVRKFNRAHGRSGTLWEGRFRATVVEPGASVLDCMVAIDSNPVRSGMVTDARDHAASSHRHYAGGGSDRRLSAPDIYWQLGNTPFAREAAYLRLVQQGLTSDRLARVVHATLQGWALGSPRFVSDLQHVSTRRLTPTTAGRPGAKPT